MCVCVRVQWVRVAEELRLEQEAAVQQQRLKKALEAQAKELGVRLDEAEQMGLKGGKKIIQKLEGTVGGAGGWRACTQAQIHKQACRYAFMNTQACKHAGMHS